MLELKRIWHMGLFLLGGTLIVFAVLSQSNSRVQGSGGTICTPQGSIVKPAHGATLSGVRAFEAYFPVSLNVYEVQFILDGTILGTGNPINDTLWRMPGFDTSVLQNNNYKIHAKAFFGATATNTSCVTSEVEFFVNNGTSSGEEFDLELFVIPNSEWTGPTNVNINFEVQLMMTGNGAPVDVSNDAVINWSTDIGSISANGKYASFSSGPNSGVGEVRVDAFYLTEDKHETIDIHVLSPEDTTGYPSSGDPNEELPDSTEELELIETDNPEVQAEIRKKIREVTFGDPVLAVCLAERFGEDDYKQLVNSEDRLSFDELTKSSQCFGGSRFVLPSNLAPIDPQLVRQLKEDNRRAKVEKIAQAQDEHGNIEGLVLSGTTDPSATVLLYIFSDPLVLTTIADSSGNWSYTLEDPLEAGDHEVFVAVEDENGEVLRSSSFGFSIAQAASTDENPTGLSLALSASTEDNSTTIYLGAAVAVVAVALGVFLVLMKRKKTSQRPQENEDISGVPG